MCFHLILAVVPQRKSPTKDCCAIELDLSLVSPANVSIRLYMKSGFCVIWPPQDEDLIINESNDLLCV